MRLKLYILVTLFSCGILPIFAQNNAFSTSWRRTIGSPDPNIDWFTSTVDNNGNTLTAGNTLSTNGENANFLISKFDKQDGSVLWEVSWNYSAINSNDYASGITVYNDEVYVCGVASGPTNSYMLVVINLHLTDGSVAWEYVYSSSSQLYSIPSAIIADDSGVFVTGATTSIVTMSDYLTIRLDANDGTEDWVTIYDYYAQYDAGLKIAFQSNNVVVTGMSGISQIKAEITAIKYDKYGGAQVSSTNVPNPGNYIDEPTDIAIDINGNVFIGGKFHDATNGIDMKVVKLDESLALDWSYQWDGNSANDVLNALALDFNGNVYVTGYTVNNENTREMITLAIDESGSQIWEKRKLVEPLYNETSGIDIEFAHDHLIALGYVERGTNKNLITSCYDLGSGFPRWIYEVQDHTSTSELPSRLIILNDHSIMLTAMQAEGNTKSYLSAKVNFLRRNREAHFDQHGHPLYAKHEVIIRFNPTVLNTTTINNRDIGFGDLAEFVNNSTLGAICSFLGTEAKGYKIVKIFPWLTTSDNTSVGRDGVEREIPAFYSWLTLELPNGIDPIWVCEQLSELTGSIVNMSVNQVGHPDEPNDEFYSLKQANLHHVPWLISNETYDINIQPAWDVKTGYKLSDDWKPLVGVYDSGVLFTHTDLQSFLGQTVTGGADFITGGSTTVFDTGDPSVSGHGTAVSGIISGTSNNGYGIAGIAGGDVSLGLESLPVELDVSRIFGNSVDLYYPNLGDSITNDSLMYSYWDVITAAQIFATLSLISDHPVSVLNQSHNGRWGLYGFEWSVIDEFSLVNRTIFNQQCLNVCSRGNRNDTIPSWPCMTFGPEIQQMNIGASDSLGLKANFSSFGGDIDITAPGVWQMVFTTHNYDVYSYWSFDGTSASAPHVAGVGALMQSYVNNHEDAPNEISPEDIEILMERFADDAVDSIHILPNEFPGYEDYSGWGKLNAGRIFDSIVIPEFRIWHFDMSISEDDLIQQPNMTLLWPRDLTSLYGFVGYTQPSYEFEVYKVQIDHYHDIQGSEVIQAWPRNSVSKTCSINNLGTEDEYLYPFPDLQIEYVDNEHAIISCYLFKFVSTGQWYPHAPIANNVQVSYTLYTHGGYTAIDETNVSPSFSVYPNPNTGNFTVEYTAEREGNCQFQVFDTQGNLVWENTVMAMHAGVYRERINLPNAAQGLYFVSIKTPTQYHSSRIFKR